MSAPTVGRVVHFTSRDGRCLAGIVTSVPTEGESLDREPIGAVVFEENGQLSILTGWRTFRGEPGQHGFWHWPERS